MSRFAPNSDLQITVQPLGHSGEPLLIIDDFLTNPDAVVAAASASKDWRNLAPGGYPGRRAPLPRDYATSVLRRVDEPIRRKLFSTRMKLDKFECSFSMVTQAPTELQQQQRIPHIDVATPTKVAVLHYLCNEQFGGTAFFRQENTGLEQIGPEQKTEYLAARSKDIAKLSADNTYPDGATPGYVQTAQTEVKFNRLVMYRSFTLHSGIINDPDLLTTDPRSGRLTANFFVDYVADG